MKSKISLFAFLFLFSAILVAQSSYRSKMSLNSSWKFSLADNINYYAEPDFDDSKWQTISVPHDWSVQSEFSKDNSGRNAFLPCGTGWYRKQVFIDKKDVTKEFKIEFDGVYKNSSLWINNHYVGTQHDGYTSFYYNITPFLRFGKKNTIALKVDNSIENHCRWYSGSGIYRNVWLTTTNKTHVDQWGTFITTPKITEEEAEVSIKTNIRNYFEATNIQLLTIVYNDNNQQVGSIESSQLVPRKTVHQINQTISIENPELWSVNSPTLYKVKTLVKNSNKIIDEYHSSFGIRTLKFDAKSGFYLNGESLKMKGVCLHHDAGILGAAVPIQVWERRLQKLKKIGCNAIRTAHNPTAPEFLDLCDKMGFLVMNEFVDKWNGNDAIAHKNSNNVTFYNPSKFSDPYFEFEWQKNYRETIKRDRNHPSVIIWSVGNENHPPGTPEQIEGLRKYTSFVREMDSTRPVISGMERSKDDIPAKKVMEIIESCKEMDLIAMNYGEQWCKAISEQNSGKAYVSTESYTYFNSSPEKRFANIERAPWLDVLDNKFNMGLFLWVGIDYLGESRKWPQLGINCGLLNRAGFRKQSSYLYEAFWTQEPMVKIAVYDGDADDFSTSGRWWWPPMNEKWNFEKGKTLDLVTYSNCESVDLYLNGKKIGNKKLADFDNWIMKWRKIEYRSGTLKAVGIINGKPVCEFSLNTTNKPHHLDFNTYKTKFTNNDVVQVEVFVKDKKGNLITDREIKLNFKLEGDSSKIIGIDNGAMNDQSCFGNTKSCVAKKGKCLVIIRKGNKSNESLLVTSEDLKKQIYRLK